MATALVNDPAPQGVRWYRSLRYRLVASFLVLAGVTVAIVAGVVSLRATDDLNRSVFDRLAAVATLKQDALGRWLDDQRRNVVFVGAIPAVRELAATAFDPDPAMDPAVRAAAVEELRAELDLVVRNTADAASFSIADEDGRIVLSTDAALQGTEQADQPWFQAGMSKTSVQNVYTSPVTGAPTITVSTPLFDPGRRRIGVLAADLDIARVDRIVLERSGLGTTGETYLIDPSRRFVGQSLVGREAFASGATSVGIEAALAGNDGQGTYANYQGIPVLGVYRWLPDQSLALVAEMQEAEALAPARDLAIAIAIVGLLSALLLTIGIWLIARRVTRPILELAGTATRVAAGDLDARAPVRSADEVGLLAGTFNGMTEQLQETLQGLESRVEARTAELSAAFGEVERQKQYFETLVHISPVAVVTMDRHERVSGWNPAATRLFGHAPEEAIGRVIDELILADPSLRAEGHDLARRLITEGETHVITRRTRKDGGIVDVEITGVPLIVDGQHIGSYAIYHDISELQQARRDADAANQAKSTFLAAMSHEIRTPMNAIIGMSGLLLDTSLDAEQSDFAETIRASGDALLTIINDILDFSKIEAGRFELDALPFSLGAVTEAALDVIAPQARAKGLEMAYAIDADLPPAFIGDAGRLRQILLNLLSNAVKFTDQGEVALRVSGQRLDATRLEAGRWRIEVRVRDTGIGIPPERMDRLFQSFSQVDVSIARRYGGTGLGLAISRRLAELMDGTLSVASSGVPGQGSTFTLRFEAEVSDLLPEASADHDAADGATALAGKRVLVVDDNDTNRRIVLAQIGRWGMVGRDSASPVEALGWVRDGEPFDLVLLDLDMPGLDGLRLARAIKEVRPTDLPLVLLSSVGHREKDQGLVAASLSKPIKPSALHDALMSVLAGATPDGAEAAARPTERARPDTDMARRLPLRILLAEDNPVNQKLAVRLLAQLGYAAEVAGNGLEAIIALEAAAPQAPFDVILMDVQMPELDGLEATRRIRAERADGTPWIVAMTANAMAEDREACRVAGMDDYVSKPIRNEALVAALLRAAEHAGAARR